MENDRKKKSRGFFVNKTRGIASRKIKSQQQKLGRKLTKEEKHKIVKKVARKAKIATFGVTLSALVAVAGGVKDTKALPDGNGQNRVKTENTKNTKDEWRNSIKVDDKDYTIETEKEESTEEKEINELESKEDVLNYFKNMYIEEYEKATGDDKLTTEDIQIQISSQNYVYELDDGTIVTHGNLPANTESAIINDGHEYTDLQNKPVYKVSRVEDGTVLDATMATGDEMRKVIIGDKYSEMKDYESILSKMGPITKDVYELMSSIEDTRLDSTSIKKNLLEHVLDYKQNNRTVDQMQNDER